MSVTTFSPSVRLPRSVFVDPIIVMSGRGIDSNDLREILSSSDSNSMDIPQAFEPASIRQ